jgi:hypothetical protein
MRRVWVGYLAATRHPWPCLLFLLPLLAVYEAGVLWLGGSQPETLRNGADAWVRRALEYFGLPQFYYAPGLIVLIFLAWSWLRRYDRPGEFVRVGAGMAVESVLFAVGLWVLSRNLGPLLDALGISLNLGPHAKTAARVITFVGAGIYEEVLFRLVLIFGLGCFFRLMGVPGLLVMLMTTLTSSVVFSAAHHIGPYGEAFDGYVFLFRSLAGFYFALLYQLRGFGIAVGTHACYDVLVGVLMV